MPVNGCSLVVIEGPDKVGKETQTKMLVEALSTRIARTVVAKGPLDKPRNLKVASEEIPYDDGNTHTQLYKMLKNGDAVTHPEAFQTFQAANRMIWQKDVLPRLASRYDVIVLDRWNISSWVYGRAGGCSDAMLECVLEPIIEPDLVFVFDGEPFHTPERTDDSYEANKALMQRVREGYRRWARENSDMAVAINANRPREAVNEELVWHCIKRLDVG